jgi:hypothetical protein
MAPIIKVLKISRIDPLQPRPKNFPPLPRLKLDLLENKKKLKLNAPKVFIGSNKPPDRGSSPFPRSHGFSSDTQEPAAAKNIILNSLKANRGPAMSIEKPIPETPKESQDFQSDDILEIDLGPPKKYEEHRERKNHGHGASRHGAKHNSRGSDDFLNSLGVPDANSQRSAHSKERHEHRKHSLRSAERGSFRGSEGSNISRGSRASSMGSKYSRSYGDESDDVLSDDDLDDTDLDTEEMDSQDLDELGEEEVDPDDPYAGLTPEEYEKKKRQEYKWRYHIIREQYKNTDMELPIFDKYKPIEELEENYEEALRNITLKENVEQYRTYLLASWLVMEYVGTQLIGIDLVGFTEAQMGAMHKYERLLIELGAKRSENWQSNWPVELRLLALVLFQAVIFFLCKVISDKNPLVASVINNFTGNNNNMNTQTKTDISPDTMTDETSKKRKMRGPSVNI